MSIRAKCSVLPVLAACAALAHVAPAAADGVIDSQYGSGGQSLTPVAAGGQVGGLAGAPDGSNVVAEWGSVFSSSDGSQSTLLATPHFNAVGTLVGGPGGIGFTRFAGFGTPIGIVREPDGTFIAGASAPAGPVLEHLRADGSADPAFGTNGFATLAGRPGCLLVPRALTANPSGTVFIVGDASARCVAPQGPGATALFVARLERDGRPNVGFRAGGAAGNPAPGHDIVALTAGPGVVALGDFAASPFELHGRSIAISPRTGDVLFGGYGPGNHEILGRMSAAGTLQWLRIGIGLSSRGESSTFTSAMAIAGDPRDDALVAAGEAIYPGARTATTVTRFLRDGTPDPAFSSGNGNGPGRALLDLAGGSAADAIALTPDGRVYAGGEVGPAGVFAVARVTPGGQLDQTFGGGGLLTSDFASSASEGVRSLLLAADGSLLLGGDAQLPGQDAVGLAKVVAAPCVICLVKVTRQSSLSPAQTATFNAILGRPSPVGFLVQRSKRGRLKTVGRIPLGAKRKGRQTIRHKLVVAGRQLAPGRYVLTLRALNPTGGVLALSHPLSITIR
jgi:beta-propeller uncharacterized protein DUF5122